MPDPATPSSGRPARAATLALAALGAAASTLLVLGHWTRLPLPGCAADSPCARAAESPWASLPLLGWPVAAVALAYFLAWLGLAGAGPARRAPAVRWAARAGAAASLLYLGVSLRLGLFCPYCLVSHAAVLGLWLLAESGRRSTPTTPTVTRRQLTAALGLAGAALAATAILSPLAAARLARLAAEEQARTAEALRKPAPAPASPLTGRYRLGPADAPVQLVVFTGYQCPDCRLLEDQLAPLLAANPDVALTVRHFPFCADCNRLAKQTIHPNACWAARAAETAGLLRGPEGFWAMHRWLFARSGGFTDAELAQHLTNEKFDAPAFLALMQSEQTLALVRSDVEVAAGLALNRTPTLFINNVELELWNAAGALSGAIAAARQGAHQTPSSAPPTAAPPTGPDRLLAEWREQPVKQVPLDLNPHALGPADAPVQVLVFGDYQDDGTVKLDERLRAIAAADPRVRYAYRHFPADQKCNPTVPRSFHPLACRLARTAETAAVVGGEEAFWKVHAFILAKHQAFTDADLRAFCEENGLGAGAILKGRDDKPIVDSLADDVAAGQAAGVTELPWLIVNNRRVPRWVLDEGDVLEQIVSEAAR